jgi:hypothetical protein
MRGSRYLVNDNILSRGRCWLERSYKHDQVGDIAGSKGRYVQQGVL